MVSLTTPGSSGYERQIRTAHTCRPLPTPRHLECTAQFDTRTIELRLKTTSRNYTASEPRSQSRLKIQEGEIVPPVGRKAPSGGLSFHEVCPLSPVPLCRGRHVSPRMEGSLPKGRRSPGRQAAADGFANARSDRDARGAQRRQAVFSAGPRGISKRIEAHGGWNGSWKGPTVAARPLKKEKAEKVLSKRTLSTRKQRTSEVAT